MKTKVWITAELLTKGVVHVVEAEVVGKMASCTICGLPRTFADPAHWAPTERAAIEQARAKVESAIAQAERRREKFTAILRGLNEGVLPLEETS